MSHHGKTVVLSALLALLLLGGPVWAGDPELKNDELTKEIRALRQELALMRKVQLVERKALDLQLRDLEERLTRIESTLARLSGPRTRGSADIPPDAATTTGAVRLVNRLPVMATVTIDGKAYNVPAFASHTIAGYPPGMITYEVTAIGYGIRAPVRTPVVANETLTLTIH